MLKWNSQCNPQYHRHHTTECCPRWKTTILHLELCLPAAWWRLTRADRSVNTFFDWKCREGIYDQHKTFNKLKSILFCKILGHILSKCQIVRLVILHYDKLYFLQPKTNRLSALMHVMHTDTQTHAQTRALIRTHTRTRIYTGMHAYILIKNIKQRQVSCKQLNWMITSKISFVLQIVYHVAVHEF